MKGSQKAINAMCKSCTFDPSARGNWRQQVTLCSVTACPLYAHRPQSTSPINDDILEYYGIAPGTDYGHTRKIKGQGVGTSTAFEDMAVKTHQKAMD